MSQPIYPGYPINRHAGVTHVDGVPVEDLPGHQARGGVRLGGGDHTGGHGPGGSAKARLWTPPERTPPRWVDVLAVCRELDELAVELAEWDG